MYNDSIKNADILNLEEMLRDKLIEQFNIAKESLLHEVDEPTDEELDEIEEEELKEIIKNIKPDKTIH